MQALAFASVTLLLLTACGQEREPLPDRPEATILEPYGEGDDADQMVLDALARAGSDLAQPTDIRWYVYFDSNRAAEAFAALARERGWAVDRKPAAAEGKALCLCSRDAAPTLRVVRAMRAELLEIGLGLSPDVDGWEAAVQASE